ncbi:MAG: BspA family leucine-rich repeat surface protein [Atopobiaceae bacterium]|nr:BspA family leucine-rich repeat surface protein [Atopobiaceae bacterium]
MRMAARRALSLGLSALLAFGTVPAQALAEAVEEVSAEEALIVKDDEPLEESDSEVTSINEAPDAEGVTIEEGQSTEDEEAIVEYLEKSQDATVASGEWGTCTWSIDGDGMLRVRPTNGVSGQLAESRGDWGEDSESYYPWYQYRGSIRSVTFDEGAQLPQDSSFLFYECSELSSVNTSGWDLSQVDCTAYMFGGCASLSSVDVGDWDVSHVTAMGGMFYGCAGLTALDVSKWNTSSVMIMDSMFTGCQSIVSLDVSRWDTSNVTSMAGMFENCESLSVLDVSGWNVASVTNMANMFKSCTALTSLDVADWNTSSVENMWGTFNCCQSLKSLDVSKWNTSHVTDMGCMFPECYELAELDVSRWDTSNVEDMFFMFVRCYSLTSLDVSHWNTSKVTRMWAMFSECGSLESLDVSGWDMSSLTNMGDIFNSCWSLTELDVSGWNTAKVAVMDGVFRNCSSLTSLDLSGWDTSQAENLDECFMGCNGLASITVGAKCGANMLAVFPDGDWKSSQTGQAYTVGQLVEGRVGIADTYTLGAGKTEIDDALVTGLTSQTYTGNAIEPKPTVSLDGTTLVLDTDYTLSYQNNVNAGTATVTVTGTGDYAGSVSTTFSIAPRAITVIDDIADVAWTGGDVTPKLTVRANGLVLGTTDYDVSYEGDRTKVGSVTVVVAAKGNYTGELRKVFNVVRVADDPPADDSVYNELKADYEQAKADADAAAETLAQKEQAYQGALAALQRVENEVGEEYAGLKSAADVAKDELDAAKSDRDVKQAALEEAQAAVDANAAATAEAESDLAAKQTKATQKQQALVAAQSAVTTAQTAHDDATSDVAAAQAAVDAKVAEAEAQAAQGSFGFFQSVGATDAVDALENCNYKDKIKKGEEVDATSLDNMKASFQWIRKLNEIRSGLGLSELKVTNLLMAYAQADADYSDTVIGHAQQFSDLSLTGYISGENAAWNWGSNPFSQWYDQEKGYFDAAYKSITGNSTVPTGEAAYTWYKSNVSAVTQYLSSNYPNKSVGHYINDINPNFSACGFGVCTRGTKYGYTYVQFFGGNTAAYTVDEYEQRFLEYYATVRGDGVAAAEKQVLSAAKATQAQKKTALDEANAALATAQSEKEAADDAVTAAQNVLTSLQDQTEGLVSSRDGAQAALATAEAAVPAKQATYDEAKSALDSFNGTARMEAAEDAVNAAKAERDVAQKARDAADATLAAAAEALGLARKLTKGNTSIEGIANVTYNGRTHTQDAAKLCVTMTRGGRSQTYELRRGTDYAVTYLDNVAAGTATVTFTGTGDYAGSVSTTFSIAPAKLTSVDAIADQTYTGSAIKPRLVVRAGKLTLGASDYDTTFSANRNVGKAKVTVTANGNFTGTATRAFVIKPASLAKATVTAASQTYTGKALTPTPVVKLGNKTLVSGTDYTTTYASNTNAGTATVTVSGAGNYTGTAKGTFSIGKRTQAISATNKSVAMGKTVGLGAKRTAGNGKLSYATSNAKVAKVSATGVITPVKVGTCKVTVTAAETANWRKATKTITVTVTKGAQPMAVKAVTRTAKAATLKKKGVTVAAPLKFTRKAQGKVTYARVAKGSAKCLTIDKKTGKVTVKKGTKAGTYKIKVKVQAAGSKNYKAGSKTVICKVVVK